MIEERGGDDRLLICVERKARGRQRRGGVAEMTGRVMFRYGTVVVAVVKFSVRMTTMVRFEGRDGDDGGGSEI